MMLRTPVCSYPIIATHLSFNFLCLLLLYSIYLNGSHSCGKEGPPQGLINYEETKPSMSSLLVFNRIYRLEIQSVTLVFSTCCVNYCPSNLFSG